MRFQVVLGESAGRTLYRVIAPLAGQSAEDAKQRLQPLGVQGSWTIDVPVAKAVPKQMDQPSTMTRQPAATGSPVQGQHSSAGSTPREPGARTTHAWRERCAWRRCASAVHADHDSPGARRPPSHAA